MLFRHLVCVLLIAWLSHASAASAMTLAVFPVEDLSQGHNGVNHELTKYLAWDMDRRGFDVISSDAVISFMGRNRVRWLGFLDTRHILLAKEELGADLVLFGTMSLRQEKLSPSMGLTLYLVRTTDARTLWTNSGGLSQQDIVNLLGLDEFEERKGLLPRLAQNVLEAWPEQFDLASKQLHALEIEEINLSPTHVRRSDTVSCRVHLRKNWAEADKPRIFFKAAGRVHLAEQSSDGQFFTSQWQVADRDGRYPVTMVINWASGYKKVAFLGAYTVDSTPPQLVLELKGVRLEGTVAFRDQVIIVPRMLRREPVARWKLTVEDESGEEQTSYNGYGQLPKRFVWDGKRRGGWPADEGVYHVTLKVWDMADNMAISTQPVALARTPPAMVLEAKNRGRDMILDLDHEGKVPIAFWRMEMRTSTGETIKVAEGDQLPVRMDVPMGGSNTIKVAEDLSPGSGKPSKVIKVAERLIPPKANGNNIEVDGVFRPEDSDTRKVECTIVLRDILGNETKEKIFDLRSLAIKQEAEKKADAPLPVWLEEF